MPDIFSLCVAAELSVARTNRRPLFRPIRTQHPPAPRQIRLFSPVGPYIISEMKSYETPNFLVHNRTRCPVDSFYLCMIYVTTLLIYWTAVVQWLRCCATNRKVAGSIATGVIGFFH